MEKIENFKLKTLKGENISKLQSLDIAKVMEKLCPSIGQWNPMYKDYAIFFASVLPLIEPDVLRMAELALYGMWICMFDDQCEKGQKYSIRLVEVINGEREPSADIPVEMYYAEVIKHIFNKLDEKEKKRMMKHTIDIITSMYQEHSINFNEISLDKFIEFRFINQACEFYLFVLEYGLGITFTDELRNTNEMKAFFFDFNKWTCIAQDMLSFKKEKLSKDPNNYLIIKMARSNLTLDEGVKECIEELDQLEIKIDQHLKTLNASDLGIDGIYFKTVRNFLNMFVKFHKYAARYNKSKVSKICQDT